jgi:hypothetical protein
MGASGHLCKYLLCHHAEYCWLLPVVRIIFPALLLPLLFSATNQIGTTWGLPSFWPSQVFRCTLHQKSCNFSFGHSSHYLQYYLLNIRLCLFLVCITILLYCDQWLSISTNVAAKAKNPSHPKNGTQQVVTDAADSFSHLQIWMEVGCMNVHAK